ncbi:Flp pilus assembly complex ATPase component TadA [Candidatus Woesearchaeota archaeon]|jgi:ATPase|nr:Flp pilus assembly complex ATPase component TadA [Candidatus Woesearchaeota archaeon]
MIEKTEKIIPDSSILIEAWLSKNSSKIKIKEIIIHEALLQKLEYLANQNNAIGALGIDEISKLNKFAEVKFSGMKLRLNELEKISMDNIDIMVKELALEEDATLITAKKTIAKAAIAKNIKLKHIEPPSKGRKIKLEKYFDTTTMSAHLRESVLPYAKKGMPGKWEFKAVGKKKLTQEDIQEISREIIEESNFRKDGFIEIERPGSTIVQLGKYRIVITKPPFSDGWEITAVRPVKKLNLEDYKLSDKLKERVAEQAEGVLIAGSPGMGKTTFAAALAEFYGSQEKIVKTVEAPRDLVLPDNITQYAISHADTQEIQDILLLSRPDYTFFDEMRNTDDFKLFADLRLAGIGFIGVVHATNPIDAIQRFVGRIELGVIPQVIDTVIFIKNGQLHKVLSLKMLVKVPSGMTEADLARPIVVVTDFETKKPEYELYSYGEETVVVPVNDQQQKLSAAKNLATQHLKSILKKHLNEYEVEVIDDNKAVIYVPEQDIPKIIGKQGKNINELEKNVGIKIDVKPISELKSSGSNNEEGEVIEYNSSIGKKSIIFDTDPKHVGKEVDIVVNGDYLLTAKVSKKARVKVRKDNKIGKIIVDAINIGEEVELVLINQ